MNKFIYDQIAGEYYILRKVSNNIGYYNKINEYPSDCNFYLISKNRALSWPYKRVSIFPIHLNQMDIKYIVDLLNNPTFSSNNLMLYLYGILSTKMMLNLAKYKRPLVLISFIKFIVLYNKNIKVYINIEKNSNKIVHIETK